MSTLARLSFWVPPEQIDSFQATYKKKLVPILNKQGLVKSSQVARSTVEGVFSRLFEVKMPSDVAIKERALHKDPAWQELLRRLGTAFGTTQPDGLLRYRFGVYRTPAGPGKTVKVGAGFRQGVWQSFNVQDGLASDDANSVAEDRGGHLWFGMWQGALILAPTASPYQPVLTDQVFENYKAMIDTAWIVGRYWGKFKFQSAKVKRNPNDEMPKSLSPSALRLDVRECSF